MSRIEITRAGPLVTVQDLGRPGHLLHGISASAALDQSAWHAAGELAGGLCGAALEFTSLGVSFRYHGDQCVAGFAGGDFSLIINGERKSWPCAVPLSDGDIVEISTGTWGNYGYVRFTREIDFPPIMGSRSTNAVVGLGGYEGRALQAGDSIKLTPLDSPLTASSPTAAMRQDALNAPIRVVWSLHADLFPSRIRAAFADTPFQITGRMDRMGVRLEDITGVFADATILSLVSDSIVPGDIQILGDGTPIVLLRDHQPTGGYPRIATIITADLDRFVQIRPGKQVRFQPVTLEAAHAALKVSAR